MQHRSGGRVRTRRDPVYSGLPRWVLIPATLGVLFVVLPLFALTTQIDWSRFGELITSESSVAALTLSLGTSSMATLACVVLGVPMALVLARRPFPPGRRLYLTIADEGGDMREGVDRLVGALQQAPPPGLEWTFVPREQETHGTTFHPAALAALRQFFAMAE